MDYDRKRQPFIHFVSAMAPPTQRRMDEQAALIKQEADLKLLKEQERVKLYSGEVTSEVGKKWLAQNEEIKEQKELKKKEVQDRYNEQKDQLSYFFLPNQPFKWFLDDTPANQRADFERQTRTAANMIFTIATSEYPCIFEEPLPSEDPKYPCTILVFVPGKGESREFRKEIELPFMAASLECDDFLKIIEFNADTQANYTAETLHGDENDTRLWVEILSGNDCERKN